VVGIIKGRWRGRAKPVDSMAEQRRCAHGLGAAAVGMLVIRSDDRSMLSVCVRDRGRGVRAVFWISQ
jgi:hypothetical protein